MFITSRYDGLANFDNVNESYAECCLPLIEKVKD